MSEPTINFILGMPRCGTTFLYHNLGKHPQVFLPFRRKTNYFSLHFKNDESWFFKHFKDLRSNKVGIDTDTLNFFIPGAIERIKEFHPNSGAKYIFIVRNPADWSLSFYKQISTFSSKMPEFYQYLKEGYLLIEDDKEINCEFRDGMLKEKMHSLLDTFGDDILFVDFNELSKDSFVFLKKIEQFFGLDSYFNEANFNNNKINSSNRSSPAIFNRLMRNKWFIYFANMLPRKLVINIRNSIDNCVVNKGPRENEVQDDSLMLARSCYKNDIEFYEEYFSAHSFRIGKRGWL